MINLRVKSNADAWVARWNKRVAQLQERTNKVPGEVANLGAAYAKTIAPIDTGTLAQAVAWKASSGAKTAKASIYIRRKKRPGPGDERDYTTFYGYQMHYGWPGFRPRNGKDRFFMFTTRKYVGAKLKDNLRLAVKQFVK